MGRRCFYLAIALALLPAFGADSQSCGWKLVQVWCEGVCGGHPHALAPASRAAWGWGVTPREAVVLDAVVRDLHPLVIRTLLDFEHEDDRPRRFWWAVRDIRAEYRRRAEATPSQSLASR
jgi:hypothetical protein